MFVYWGKHSVRTVTYEALPKCHIDVTGAAELEKPIYGAIKWDTTGAYESEVAPSKEPTFNCTIIDTLDNSAGNDDR